jgi:Rab-GTPase-TBC domain
VFYSEFYDQPYLIPQFLKQIYTRYLSPFLNAEKDGQLSFTYATLLLKRLLYHYHPDLMMHLSSPSLGFTSNLFPLVSWTLTLFSHALPLQHLTDSLWTEIFSQPPDHLIFLAVTILGGSFKPKLMMLHELSDLLASLKSMNELVDVSELIREARRVRAKTPESMIIAEFNRSVEPIDQQLLQNEYFA